MKRRSSVQQPDPADLQRRMAQVRQDLEHNSARLKENAQTLADWRYYVRRYPWLTVAVAGTIGFMLVPKRAKPAPSSVEALAQLAREHGYVLQGTSDKARSNGLFTGLASMIGKTLLRSGSAYVAGQLGQILAGRMATPPAAPAAHEPTYGVSH
jgi:hypothetical protein